MTTEEFISEVKKSSLCPQNFDVMMTLVKKYQTLAVNTLVEFDRICRLNGIKYQLAFGSLLGAVRDGGMIPWDYDVDVFVFASDRKKLIKALEKDLNENYHFNSFEKNNGTQGMITRIAPKPYETDHLHVDVFYLTGTSEDSNIREKESKEIRRSCYIVDAGIKSTLIINPFVHPKGFAVSVLRLIRYCFFSKRKAGNRYLELISLHNEKKCSKLINANSFAGTYFMKAENMLDVIDYQTSFGTFSVPVKYDAVLKDEFGSYTELPLLRDRVKAVKIFYNMFLKMEKTVK